VTFAGRGLTSTNQYKNILGIFPKEWRLPLAFRRGNDRKETLVRLMGNIDAQPDRPMEPMPRPKLPPGTPPPKPGDGPGSPRRPPANAAARKLVIEKKGFANYYFNKLEQNRLLDAFRSSGDFSSVTGPWAAEGTIDLVDRRGDLKLTIHDGTDGSPEVKIARSGIEDTVFPLKSDQSLGELMLPQGSGGLLVSLYLYRRLLTQGPAGFEGTFDHGGHEPCYPPPADGKAPESWKDLRVDCEVLRTKHASFESKWYFERKDHRLIACETTISKDEDPCELYFADYKPVDGRHLPHRIEVRHGDKRYALITLKSYRLTAK
jgi:hypothetical protein